MAQGYGVRSRRRHNRAGDRPLLPSGFVTENTKRYQPEICL